MAKIGNVAEGGGRRLLSEQPERVENGRPKGATQRPQPLPMKLYKTTTNWFRLKGLDIDRRIVAKTERLNLDPR